MPKQRSRKVSKQRFKKVSKQRSKKVYKISKRFKRSKKSILKRALIGTGIAAAGLTTTALVAKKLKIDYNLKDVFEEDSLLSDIDEELDSDSDANSLVKWKNLTKDDFQTRSINWTKSNKEKAPSPGLLYNTYKIEMIKSSVSLKGIIISKKYSKRLNLTSLNGNNSGLPDYFIVNAELPPLGQVFYSVVICYKIADGTIQAANDPDYDSKLNNSIKLLKNFISNYKEYSHKFKGVATIKDTGSLNIGAIGEKGISIFGLTTQKAAIFDKTVEHVKKDRIFEMDIDINKFKLPPIITSFVTIDRISTYYDKTQNIDLNIGFIIAGDKSDELPEVLLGATKIISLEFVNPNTEKSFIANYPLLDKMVALMNSIDPLTVKMGDLYREHISDILLYTHKNFLYPRTARSEQDMNFNFIPECPKDPRVRNSENNKKIFMYARYLYYKDGIPICSLENRISYKAKSFFGKGKNIARGTCFGNDKIFNMYKCTNHKINTYRFGTSIRNAFENFDFCKAIIDKINNFDGIIDKTSNFISTPLHIHKKLIWISFLTPCNNMMCKAVKAGSKLLPKEAYLSFLENNILEAEYKAINESGNIFLHVPLSKKVMYSNTNTTSVGDFVVDISSDKATFETLVGITWIYYINYKGTHHLCYHCKSGKDRTGVGDSIIQATLYYLQKETIETMEQLSSYYEKIRNVSAFYLYFSYVILFFSTGIPGIKMKNIPVAKYILLEQKFNFFLGNSRLSGS